MRGQQMHKRNCGVVQSWRVTLPCTREDAERLKEDIGALALLDNPPVLMTSEADSKRTDDGQLDAYYDAKHGKALLTQLRELLTETTPNPGVKAITEANRGPLSQNRN